MVFSAARDTSLPVVIKIGVFIVLQDKQGKIVLEVDGCSSSGVEGDFTTQTVVIIGIAEGLDDVSCPTTLFSCGSVAVAIV